MAVNQKAVKVLNKVLEAGFTDEKAISAMTMDDILSMQSGWGHCPYQRPTKEH